MGAERYGLPYMGSKNSIAEWVVTKFPRRENFYDLFCGGCAITHASLVTNKFHNFFANDLNPMSSLFIEAVHGKYHDEKRWISRDEFEANKKTDAYIAFVWSFGNNCDRYMYSKEIEPWKKALHFARVFGDYSLLKSFGIETKNASQINVRKHEKQWKEKYITWYVREVLHSDIDVIRTRQNLTEKIQRNEESLRNYLLEGLRKSGKKASDVDKLLGTNGMAGHYFGKSQWEFPTREAYQQMQTILYLPFDYEEVYGLQELYESLQSLQFTNKSYDEVDILPNSLVYCDIPYKGTAEYVTGGFDHKKFYDWCHKQKELVIVSEYSMPSDFVCIATRAKRNLLSTNKSGLEKLFVPAEQFDRYNELIVKRQYTD